MELFKGSGKLPGPPIPSGRASGRRRRWGSSIRLSSTSSGLCAWPNRRMEHLNAKCALALRPRAAPRSTTSSRPTQCSASTIATRGASCGWVASSRTLMHWQEPSPLNTLAHGLPSTSCSSQRPWTVFPSSITAGRTKIWLSRALWHGSDARVWSYPSKPTLTASVAVESHGWRQTSPSSRATRPQGRVLNSTLWSPRRMRSVALLTLWPSA
mmetsp:Transcript_4239/g.12270  ORF Transcript_4239/g.12270 Transcript_4239/m.12270 type:complete len:212 (-) Transcript_4239:733-1368(-)